MSNTVKRTRRTPPSKIREACGRLAGKSSEPIEFRSVRQMNEYIKAHTAPLMSDDPCACGGEKLWGHKYCSECKGKRRHSLQRGNRA